MSKLYTTNYTGTQTPFMFNAANRTSGDINTPTFTISNTIKNVRHIIGGMQANHSSFLKAEL
jgi:hypothetical protein